MVKTEKSPEIRTKIFSKGLALFEGGRVIPNGESERTVYLIVESDQEKYDVRLSSDGTFSCTCMRGSLQGATRGAICSHVIAAILHLADRSRKSA